MAKHWAMSRPKKLSRADTVARVWISTMDNTLGIAIINIPGEALACRKVKTIGNLL